LFAIDIPVETAQAFGFPFVQPIAAQFLAGQKSGYEHGANFAYGGATATNLLASPFSLSSEVLQFFSFRLASTIPCKFIPGMGAYYGEFR